jgi:hypothetical protein
MSVTGPNPGLFDAASCPSVLTWVPEAVLAEATGLAEPAEALCALAERLKVTAAFVPAGSVWARRAAELLADAGIEAVWAVDGPFGRVATARGWAAAVAQSASAPAELAYALAEALHDTLDDARRAMRADAHSLVVADDLAGAAGWLVSPDYSIEVLVPLYQRVVAEVAPAGVSCVFHSDGDIRALLGPLARAGFRAVHPGGADAANLEAVCASAAEVGMRVLGGFRAGDTPAHESATVETLARLSSDGTLIVSDDGGFAERSALDAFGAVLGELRRRC